jgi:hypothetical protein
MGDTLLVINPSSKYMPMFKSFSNNEQILNFGKKVELGPLDILKKASDLGGVENEILRAFCEEWNRVLIQAEIGGGVIADDRLLLDRLKADTLTKLSEHGIEVSSADLEAFVDLE